MHEMGIALQIVEIAKSAIPSQLEGTPIEAVNLKVGKLTAIVPESLRFCWDVVIKDTPLAGSRLEIEEIPIVARCKSCGHEFTIEGPAFTCVQCEGGDLDIISGRELTVTSLEVAE
ncbi:MAG: hydrogenase maturation nickel metallochaperone HypA [Desulfatibacillaceae bacterium]